MEQPVSQQHDKQSGVPRSFGRVRGRMKTTMVTGLLTLVPLGATFVMLRWVLGWMDSIAAPFLRAVFGIHIPGLGVVLTLVTVYLVGFLTTNLVGKRVIGWVDSALRQVPFVKLVYSPVKRILGTFEVSQHRQTWRTVLVEYPRRDAWMVAFVAGAIPGPPGEPEVVSVFIPNTPNPTSGRVIIVPRQDVHFIDMTIQEAIEFVVSGGTAITPSLILPSTLAGRLGTPAEPDQLRVADCGRSIQNPKSEIRN